LQLTTSTLVLVEVALVEPWCSDAVKEPKLKTNPLDKIVKGTSLTQREVTKILNDPVAKASAARYQAMAQSSVFKPRMMAQGGVVTRPTLAMIGEKGSGGSHPIK
jgi:hypothetical protein